MNKIIIEYPDDCTEQDAMVYATGCFTPCQHDYKARPKGFRQGESFEYGDGRPAFFYRSMDDSYVLNIKPKR